MSKDQWIRVSSRGVHCPICSHLHSNQSWCLVKRDGTAAICPRVAEGSVRDLGEAGYLHELGSPIELAPHALNPRRRPGSQAWLDPRTSSMQYQGKVEEDVLAAFAEHLGVTPASLKRLGIGWSDRHQAWTFPMSNGQGRVIGIRLRSPDGDKWCIRGSRQGLFIPRDLNGEGELMICEGPTDLAYLLDIGYDAIGRPSNTGGVNHLIEYLSTHRRDVVICRDADPRGSRADQTTRLGVSKLGSRVAKLGLSIKVIAPIKGKDIRAWSPSRAVIQSKINAAPLGYGGL